MYQLGNIYSLRIFDYPKTHTNLSTARMLAQEEGDDYELALILLRLANIHNICYDEEDKKSTYALLSEALHRAIAGNNDEVMTRLAINMSIMQVLKKGWGIHAGEIARIRNYRFPADSHYRTICVNIIDGMNAYFRGDQKTAENHYRKVLDSLPDDQSYRERFVYGTMYLLQYVYENSGDYAAEEKLLRDRLRFVQELGLDDYELYTYSHLVNFFKRRNQPDSVRKYTYLYSLPVRQGGTGPDIRTQQGSERGYASSDREVQRRGAPAVAAPAPGASASSRARRSHRCSRKPPALLPPSTGE